MTPDLQQSRDELLVAMARQQLAFSVMLRLGPRDPAAARKLEDADAALSRAIHPFEPPVDSGEHGAA